MNGREIIAKEYGGSTNFMTPRILEYGNIASRIGYEISKGDGIEHETIYGLSIAWLHPDGTTDRMWRLGAGCYHSLLILKRDIAELRERFHRE